MGKAVELCPLEGGGRSWQWRRLFGCCRNLVPRGRRLCSVRNRYADWVQAQPAAGEGAALFPVGGRRGASLSPAADRGKGAALFSAYAVYAPTIEKPPTGRFFWIVRIGSLLGTFSLTKSSPSRKTICLAAFPFKRRLNDKGVSHVATCDQRLCLWKPQPFEKGWRKLLF